MTFDATRAPLKYTSYFVALLAVHASVTFAFTLVAPFAGLGPPGALGRLGVLPEGLVSLRLTRGDVRVTRRAA